MAAIAKKTVMPVVTGRRRCFVQGFRDSLLPFVDAKLKPLTAAAAVMSAVMACSDFRFCA
jgi:hypothetical protein